MIARRLAWGRPRWWRDDHDEFDQWPEEQWPDDEKRPLRLRRNTVTVGIAAICSSEHRYGDTLICAADTELSLGGGFTSQRFYQKIDWLWDRWFAIVSAEDVTEANELLETIPFEFNETVVKWGRPDVVLYPAIVRRLFDAARRTVITERAGKLMPPGLTLTDFLASGKAMLPEQDYRALYQKITGPLRCTLILAGIDSRGAGLLFTGGRQPAAECTKEGFCAVGSGGDLASAILSAYDQSKADGWRETAYRVLAAKRAAERAEGVGTGTTMFRITSAGYARLDHFALYRLIRKYGLLPSIAVQERLRPILEHTDLVKEDDVTPWNELPMPQPTPVDVVRGVVAAPAQPPQDSDNGSSEGTEGEGSDGGGNR